MTPGRVTRDDGGSATQTAQLVADHHQALYRYAYRLTGASADAEDLVQQAFLIAHQHADQVRDPDRMRGWLFAVLRSCYTKQRRRRQPLSAASLELNVNLVAAAIAPETIDQGRLQQAIDSLADEFKVVVLMFYFEYQSYRQIAEQLQIPLGTVMSRLARAKAHLKCRLFEPEVNEAPLELKSPQKVRDTARLVEVAPPAVAR
jgi:RNA polymerase sigma-70 factor (ECF subfamily)